MQRFALVELAGNALPLGLAGQVAYLLARATPTLAAHLRRAETPLDVELPDSLGSCC